MPTSRATRVTRAASAVYGLPPLPLLTFLVVGNALVPIAERYLTRSLDPFTLSFYRFLAGGLFLLIIAVRFVPDVLKAMLTPRKLTVLFGTCVLFTVVKVLSVAGLARTPAVLSSLINLGSLPLALGLALWVFPDERRSTTDKRFYIGAAIALIAAIALALSNGGQSAEYSEGTLYLVIAALLTVGVSLLSKRLMISFHPVCYGAIVNLMMATMLFFCSLVWSNLGKIASLSFGTNLILFGSGVYGQVAGTLAFLYAIKRFGVVVTRLAELSAPVFVGLFGYLAFGESLQPIQLALGAILIFGCYLILAKRQ